MKALFAAVLFSALAFAQGGNSPDLSFSFQCSGASNCTPGITQYPNSTETIGIRYWTFEYKITGYSGVSIVLQGAPDSSGAPGTWATFPGTVYNGANPSTSTTGAMMSLYITPANDTPWVRINVTSVTGTGSLKGQVYGYRNSPGCTVPCVDGGQGGGGITPVVIGTSSTAVSLSSSGLTQVVAAPGTSTQSIHMTFFDISFASAVNFQWEYGTGSSCGTGTTALTGTYQGVLTMSQPFGLGGLTVPAGNALCANLGSSVTGGGLLLYAVF